MAFIGNNVTTQGFTPAIDYFSGNGVTVTFTLSRPLVSTAQVIAVIENVPQNPSTAFSVSGNSITFTSAPPSGSNNIWVEYTSLITTYNAISQDPSVIGDITATGGFLSTGDFGNTFTDGTIVDYVTGNARITTGPADGFTVYNGGTSARTALMAIDSSGNVGIGTTSPTQKLEVSGAGAACNIKAICTGSSGTAGNSVYSILQGAQAASNYYRAFISTADGTNYDWGIGNVGTSTKDVLAFYSGGLTERMRIDSSGNVGIGTTSPSNKLDVYRSTFGGSNTSFILSSTNSSSAKINYAGIGYVVDQGAAGSEAGSMYFSTYVSGALTERLRITSTGTLVQTLNPSYFNVDASPCTVTLTNGSNVNWGNAYSGVIFVTDCSITGQSAVLICGGGSTYVYGAGQFTNTSGSGTFRFYNSGSGYVLVNASGSTATFGLFVVRTRAST